MAANLVMPMDQKQLPTQPTTAPWMWRRTAALAPREEDDDSWEARAFAEDASGLMGGTWPPRSYSCSFCRREFRSAQALGGHMNVHRRDRARLRQSSPGAIPPDQTGSFPSTPVIMPTQEFPAGLCFLYPLPATGNPGSENPLLYNPILGPTPSMISTSPLMSPPSVMSSPPLLASRIYNSNSPDPQLNQLFPYPNICNPNFPGFISSPHSSSSHSNSSPSSHPPSTVLSISPYSPTSDPSPPGHPPTTFSSSPPGSSSLTVHLSNSSSDSNGISDRGRSFISKDGAVRKLQTGAFQPYFPVKEIRQNGSQDDYVRSSSAYREKQQKVINLETKKDSADDDHLDLELRL